MKRLSPPAPCCASSTNPAARLFQAVQRYTDGLHVAAEQLVGPQTVGRSSTKPTSTFPDSPLNPPGRPCEPTCSPSRPKPEAPTPPPADSRQRTRPRTAGDMAAVLYWRLPELTPRPRSAAWLPGIPETLHSHPAGGLPGKAIPAGRRPRRPDPRSRLPSGRPASLGCTGKHPSTALVGDIAVWRAANGINPQDPDQPEEPARNASGPVETTPRPGYRACHQPASRCEGRQATRRTHRTQSKGRQAAPVPTTRTASQRAVRARPIAHLSRQIAALRT
jgi:hypothetical protein